MLLGSIIRRLRLASGLSQVQLAKRSRVSASFLSLVERDKREPTLTVLRRIAEQLKVPFAVLLMSALAEGDDPKWEGPISKLLDALRLHLITQAADEQQSSFFAGNEAEHRSDR